MVASAGGVTQQTKFWVGSVAYGAMVYPPAVKSGSTGVHLAPSSDLASKDAFVPMLAFSPTSITAAANASAAAAAAAASAAATETCRSLRPSLLPQRPGAAVPTVSLSSPASAAEQLTRNTALATTTTSAPTTPCAKCNDSIESEQKKKTSAPGSGLPLKRVHSETNSKAAAPQPHVNAANKKEGELPLAKRTRKENRDANITPALQSAPDTPCQDNAKVSRPPADNCPPENTVAAVVPSKITSTCSLQQPAKPADGKQNFATVASSLKLPALNLNAVLRCLQYIHDSNYFYSTNEQK